MMVELTDGAGTGGSATDKNTLNTEIEEENKGSQAESEHNELFKHLSYLSQLSSDVSKHQHVEQPGPGEYKIKLFDATAASPASIKLDENGEVREPPNTTGRKHTKRNSLQFELDNV